MERQRANLRNTGVFVAMYLAPIGLAAIAVVVLIFPVLIGGCFSTRGIEVHENITAALINTVPSRVSVGVDMMQNREPTFCFRESGSR